MFATKIQGNMELKVEEILKTKGMRMADLAAKLNVDQSNLTKSLEGNPKLSRLKEVASALDVSVRDLFSDAEPSLKEGLLRVGDRYFALVPVVVSETANIYNSGRFYKAAYEFVMKCLKNRDRASSFCGLYGGVCPFALTYDCKSQQFLFSFSPTGGQYETWTYDPDSKYVLSFGYTDDLAADYIARNIINDIEESGHD